MNTKHTPGPWWIDHRDDVDLPDHVGISAEGHGLLAQVVWRFDGEQSNSRCEATAHLIMAAPDLLKALKKRAEVDAAYARLALMEGAGGEQYEKLLASIEEAEEVARDLSGAAIAKATRETQNECATRSVAAGSVPGARLRHELAESRQPDECSRELRRLHEQSLVLVAKLNHACAQYESAAKLLHGIHALLYPAPLKLDDGGVMVFRPEDLDPHQLLQDLSDRIRALPDKLAAIDNVQAKT